MQVHVFLGNCFVISRIVYLHGENSMNVFFTCILDFFVRPAHIRVSCVHLHWRIRPISIYMYYIRCIFSNLNIYQT